MNFLENLDRKLKGLPERSLTTLLLIVGIIAIIVAVYGTPTLKAALVLWIVAP